MTVNSGVEPERRVEWDDGQDPPVLRVWGVYDQSTVGEVEALLGSLSSGSALVLNLRGVEYLSSTGIGQIVHLSSRFGLVVADPSPASAQILRLAEVWPILRVGGSETEAMRQARERC